MLHSTGDPGLDSLIAAHPGLRSHIERELRYGQTRWAEVWLACIMTVYGAVLLGEEGAFAQPSYRIIRDLVSEETAGLIAILVGTARLVALWYNGSRRRSPIVRLLGCSGGFLFYAGLTAGFALAAPPVSTGMIYAVLAAAELHSSSRSARDVCVLDSLGSRSRRRAREQLASRG